MMNTKKRAGVSTVTASEYRQSRKRDLFSDTWIATDELGREIATYEKAGEVRKNKTVALFYYLWHQPRHIKEIYDNTKILASQSEPKPWGPLRSFHYWGEPYFGYYHMDDKFVIRKHAQMITDAGVDVIFFDATNAITYPESYIPVCEVYTQIRKEGGVTPQIAFLLNSKMENTAGELWDDFYSKGLYRELWFIWKDR